ncbi:MAG: hypothetical protein K0U98_17605 [Deltaproteobacteria bacterium]|nr:hypothetical protein [Deltaproteobacteria bacterium]
MGELQIARIILFVKDIDLMVSFYEDVLRLSRTNSPDDSEGFVSFDVGAAQLALHQIPETYARNITISDPPVARGDTPIKLAFGAENVSQISAELKSRGAAMGPVQEFGSLHLCDGMDPEGNIFQISNRP